MRKFFILLLVPLLLLININKDFEVGEAKEMNGFDITYTSEIYEPIDERIIFTVRGSVFIHQGVNNSSLRLMYQLYSPAKYGMERYYASGYASKTFSYPSTKSLDYSFRLDDYDNYARYGITVRFGLYDTSKRAYVNCIDSHLSGKKSQNINVDEIDGDLTYEPCLYISEDKLIETFNFSNLSHTLDLSNYYKLDLSSLSFYYDFYKEFEVDELYIEFLDSENLFPYLEEESGYKRIPLYIKEDNHNLSFVFKNLYVKPDTLEMSVVNREGFTPTNYFFLPKNKINKLQGFKFTLRMVNGGVSNITFSYEVEVGINALLLGPCSESMFCVVSGVVS